MGDRSAIGWTDATWNPVHGCSRVSEGCRFCYAEKESHRFGWTKSDWTARNAPDNVQLRPERLDQPLRWRKPRKIFVNSMSDLFHEQIPFGFIAQVFAVMALCPQHQFQVLTKRPERMLEFFSDYAAGGRHIWEAGQGIRMPRGTDKPAPGWPLPNVWLGVSVEDQRTADERIHLLLQTPAAVRWISAEPLLGPVDLRYLQPGDTPVEIDALSGTHGVLRPHGGENARLDWVVVGGESGPNARPMMHTWAQRLRDQCHAAGVAFFMKQLSRADIRNHKNLDAFPVDLRVREYPNAQRN